MKIRVEMCEHQKSLNKSKSYVLLFPGVALIPKLPYPTHLFSFFTSMMMVFNQNDWSKPHTTELNDKCKFIPHKTKQFHANCTRTVEEIPCRGRVSCNTCAFSERVQPNKSNKPGTGINKRDGYSSYVGEVTTSLRVPGVRYELMRSDSYRFS